MELIPNRTFSRLSAI